MKQSPRQRHELGMYRSRHMNDNDGMKGSHASLDSYNRSPYLQSNNIIGLIGG